MTRITAIANQKGGVGKTSTAHALVTGLTVKGYKALAIDADPQGNLSNTMNTNYNMPGVYEVMSGTATVADAIQHSKQGDIIASTARLTGADLEFTDMGREYLLRDKIAPILSHYDYIIIDTPPTLGIITINALTAATDAIIPMGADVYSLQGLGQLHSVIGKVKQYCNPGLVISGLLITRYVGRAILTQDLRTVIEDKAKQIGSNLYHTVIREGIAVKESQAQQESLFASGLKSNPAKDYLLFIDEYLQLRKVGL